MRRILIAIALTLAANGMVLAQSKVPVYVADTVTDNDTDGRSLVFELKEAIRGSYGYRLVTESRKWPYVKLAVVTIPATSGSPLRGTAYSYAIVYDSLDMPEGGRSLTRVSVRAQVETLPSVREDFWLRLRA